MTRHHSRAKYKISKPTIDEMLSFIANHLKDLCAKTKNSELKKALLEDLFEESDKESDTYNNEEIETESEAENELSDMEIALCDIKNENPRKVKSKNKRSKHTKSADNDPDYNLDDDSDDDSDNDLDNDPDYVLGKSSVKKYHKKIQEGDQNHSNIIPSRKRKRSNQHPQQESTLPSTTNNKPAGGPSRLFQPAATFSKRPPFEAKMNSLLAIIDSKIGIPPHQLIPPFNEETVERLLVYIDDQLGLKKMPSPNENSNENKSLDPNYSDLPSTPTLTDFDRYLKWIEKEDPTLNRNSI